MDQNYPNAETLSYSTRAPVVMIGTAGPRLDRAISLVAGAGLRSVEPVPISHARERLAQQASASAVWIELEGAFEQATGELLDAVDQDVADGRYAAIVSATATLIDPVFAHVAERSIEVIVDADDQQRAAALALAMSGAGVPIRVSDVAADQNAARLRQLSEEVNRIASTLARLSSGPTASTAVALQPAPTGEVPAVSADVVRSVIRARRLRARFFSEELFADPAWDMLLDLLQAEISQLRVPVSSLCIAAAVPATTALRWLKTLVDEGLFVRRADPHDGRRVFVELSPDASLALRRYFAEVGPAAVI